MNAERYWITDGAEKSKGDTHFEPESDRSKLPTLRVMVRRWGNGMNGVNPMSKSHPDFKSALRFQFGWLWMALRQKINLIG